MYPESSGFSLRDRMLGLLYSISFPMYTVPALHDEGRAAMQADAESRTWLKQ